jgi:hypothetical protein
MGMNSGSNMNKEGTETVGDISSHFKKIREELYEDLDSVGSSRTLSSDFSL